MPTDEQLAAGLLGRVDHGRVATSMRALPFLAAARHVVVDGRVLLRMHRGYGYHRACVGSVVAYGADSLGPGSSRAGEGHWSVQVVGVCEAVEPTGAQLELLGPAPRLADGEPFEPVYLEIDPQFATVHSTDGALQLHHEHCP
ncbi:pyridoxamine 5'-phosphate oxidase family protein [Streptomyces sp. NPDC050704]|uniref:pyridoxamine 5'-phosphate oxidase family protein n=1 Tax=Streptomyces sp. NPDC050704 TaxID=3157219 RepID=UPI003414B111